MDIDLPEVVAEVRAAFDEIEERARHLAGGNQPQVLDARHTFHGQAIIATSRVFSPLQTRLLIPL